MNLNSFLVVFSLVILTGCATAPDSYRMQGAAVPAGELAARGAGFANQAEQFHQAALGIKICPNGTLDEKGGGGVTAGAGDNSGRVNYSISTYSGKKVECDFGHGKTSNPSLSGKSVPPAEDNAKRGQSQESREEKREARQDKLLERRKAQEARRNGKD